MSPSPSPPPEPASPDEPLAIDAEPTQQDEQEAQASTDQPKPKKAKASASEPIAREPGKSLLPYSRVQKILKADRDLIMVQREAVFLISRATEQRVTAQSRAYDERKKAIPLLEPKPAPIKPGKAKDSKATKSGSGDQVNAEPSSRRQPTMLDQFVQSGKNDMQDSQGEVFENEDGTLSGGAQLEVPA
ncbi:hypothetical protein V8D89_011337 [Ganoderma adspersum]